MGKSKINLEVRKDKMNDVIGNQALIQGIEMILGMAVIDHLEGVEITKNKIILGYEKSSDRKKYTSECNSKGGKKEETINRLMKEIKIKDKKMEIEDRRTLGSIIEIEDRNFKAYFEEGCLEVSRR